MKIYNYETFWCHDPRCEGFTDGFDIYVHPATMTDPEWLESDSCPHCGGVIASHQLDPSEAFEGLFDTLGMHHLNAGTYPSWPTGFPVDYNALYAAVLTEMERQQDKHLAATATLTSDPGVVGAPALLDRLQPGEHRVIPVTISGSSRSYKVRVYSGHEGYRLVVERPNGSVSGGNAHYSYYEVWKHVEELARHAILIVSGDYIHDGMGVRAA